MTNQLLAELEMARRQIAIKDAYFWLIYAIGCDYDGYESAEKLKELIDELVAYADYGRANDDKYVKDLLGGDSDK